MNEELIHVEFEEFLKKNPFYAESFDHEKEMYYELFKAGYEVGKKAGYDQGYDVGFDAGTLSTLYNSNDMYVY